MKVIERKNVIMEGLGKSVTQSISAKNSSRAAYFLRDRIYTDKLKAAICEPVCNAVDEHRKHNVSRPVEILILGKEVVIRDFAKGLSDDKLYYVFFQYFESTKDMDNEGIGGFGIGAKAPGAYSDIYYVESYYEGTHSIFVSTVQGYDAVVNKIMAAPCDVNDTGIAVRIPYNRDDLKRIQDLLEVLYATVGGHSDTPVISVRTNLHCDTYSDYIDADPKVMEYTEINNYDGRTYKTSTVRSLMNGRLANVINKEIHEPTLINIPGKYMVYCGGNLFPYAMFNNHTVLFYDGDMLYPASLNDEQSKLISSLELTSKYLSYTAGYQQDRMIIMFKRGELQIAPSRENIEQTPKLTALLKRTLAGFHDDIKNDVKRILKDSLAKNTVCPWRKPNYSEYVCSDLYSRYADTYSKDIAGCDYKAWQSLFLLPFTNYLGTPSDSPFARRYRIVYSDAKERCIPNRVNDSKSSYSEYLFRDLPDDKYIVVGMNDAPMTKVCRAVEFMSGCTSGMVLQVESNDILAQMLTNISTAAANDANLQELIEKVVIKAEDLLKYIPEDEEEEYDRKESKNKKKKAAVRELRTLYSSYPIPEEEYPVTAVVKKSDYNTSSYGMLHNAGVALDSIKNLTGIKYIVGVDAGDIAYWKRRGAVEFDFDALKNNLLKLVSDVGFAHVKCLSGFESLIVDLAGKASNSMVGTLITTDKDKKFIHDGKEYSLSAITVLLYNLSIDKTLYELNRSFVRDQYASWPVKDKMNLIYAYLACDKYNYHCPDAYGDEAWKAVKEDCDKRLDKLKPRINAFVKNAVKTVRQAIKQQKSKK